MLRGKLICFFGNFSYFMFPRIVRFSLGSPFEEHLRRGFLPLFRYEQPRVRHCPGTFAATCQYYRVIRGAKRLFPVVWRTFRRRRWNPPSTSFCFSLPGGCAFAPPVFHSFAAAAFVVVVFPRRCSRDSHHANDRNGVRRFFRELGMQLTL